MRLPKWIKWPPMVIAGAAIAAIAAVYVLQEPIPGPGTGAATGSRVYNTAYAEPIEQVRDDLDRYRVSLVSPSISVAVAVGGELVWADARGYADIESQTLATTDTVYAIGSVSKPITAVLTASLWQAGLLELDADIREYVSGFPARQYPVTLRQLLSHQAGIRHYGFRFSPPTFSESELDREFSGTAESLALFADDDLLFEPDTDFHYSTFGYTLVSAAIEGVTGQPYSGALAQYVLEPLEMRGTSIDKAECIQGVRASDYVGTFSRQAVIRAPATNSSYKWAGGGLASTPTDLARFGSAMLDNRLLNERTRVAVLDPRSLPGGELNPQHYALGWRIGGLAMEEKAGDERIIPLWHHSGTRAGSTAVLMIVPDHEIVVAMTSNTVGRGGSAPLTGVAAKVARQFIRFEINSRG